MSPSSDKVARTAPGSAAGSPVAVPRAASGALRTQVPLPSPLEVVGGGAPARHSGAPGSAAAKAAAGHGSSNSSKKLTHSAAYPHGPQSAPMLSAQTVTTTTVTTTTVTTYPPLKLPRVEKQRRLSPDMYPLSQMPAPPALEQFALNVGGQRLYFSQRDVENCQSEDVLGSITSNITATEPAGALGSAGAPLPAFPAQNELQRAITPLYTQDDAHHHHQHTDTSSRFVDPIEYGQQRRHLGGDQMHRYSSPSRESRQPYRNRRSSSPPSPDQHRHFQQRNVYSPSPRAAHNSSSNGDDIIALDDPAGGTGGGGVLPLPSPLLSPRARPDDEVDEYHGVRRHTSTRTSRTVADSQMSRGMEAMYSLPSIMSTYDNLPASMQTFLLYQLLRRTSRPVLQFASQTILPVLHRDFITDLPVEVSHHILKFMDTRTLCRASCVSNRWQDVVNGNRKVWRARLEDARYVPEAQRIHPLSHTHFGLGKEPPRPITAHKPTRAELDLSSLAERPSNTSAAQKLARAIADDTQGGDHAAWNASASPILTNPFKSEFEHAYRLDRNWQEGRCKHLSFISDAGSVVTCVQLTDDHIIAGFDTKDIYVFDIKTGAVVRQLVGHDGGVWALAVVGSTVISGSTDRTVRVWDLDTGRCTHVFSGHSSTVRCLQVLLPVDVRTPEERARGDPVRYEPSEPYIITGSRDTTLRMWKLPSPTKDAPYITRTGVAARATAAATPAPAAAGPATAAAGTALVEDGMASLFSRHMQNLHRAEGPGGALGGSRPFSFLQQQLQQQQQHATAAQVPQADVPLPRVNPYFVRVLEGHTESVRAVAGFGNMVVSGSYDFSIRIWDLQTGQCTHQLEGHTAKVYTLVLDTDLHLIFSGSMDGTIRVWNWDSGACLRILRGHLTLVGLLAMDHNTLVSAGADASLRIWDHPIRPQETPATRQRPFSNIEGDTIDNKSPPLSSFASAAPHAIAAAAAIQQAGNIQQMNLLQQLQMQQRANDQLHMQQMANNPEMVPSELLRTERFVLRQHTNAITCFQHDGTKIVSGADNTVKLWDVRTGLFVRDLLSNLSGVWQVRFDKKRCVAAVHRNDVTYFEIMDFDVDVDSSGE
ncbi:WD40 repeat-like protein [Martensiomyces pterosporus]|nr:WD40 repeat-like protein [Martensiomyces pterosporus]